MAALPATLGETNSVVAVITEATRRTSLAPLSLLEQQKTSSQS